MLAKEYSEVNGLNYVDIFSPIANAKMTYVLILVSLVAIYHWPLHQLDVKNAFLNGILDEEIYMEQPPSFVAHRECAKICRLK